MSFLNSFKTQRILLICNIQKSNYSKFIVDKELKKCYNMLEVSEDSDQEQIRTAYLKLVKRFHPDSGTPEANSDKFLEIDKAFRILLRKKSKERWISKEEIDVDTQAREFDIKHTAPQHRQYLNYDGIGMGTPFQRQKQYGKMRAAHAAENILNHRLSKAQADEKTLMDKKPQKHKIKTKYGYERLVEDLIQEAMSRGEFDNLSGRGKPLPSHQNSNPYVDFITHKLNQVLIENGFTPQWIMLQKEIREEKNILQNFLYSDRTNLGKYPFDDVDTYKWNKTLENCTKVVENLNKKIEKYNLLVPVLQKQMLLIYLDKEAEKVAKYGQTKHDVQKVKRSEITEARENPQNVYSFIESFFYKN